MSGHRHALGLILLVTLMAGCGGGGQPSAAGSAEATPGAATAPPASASPAVPSPTPGPTEDPGPAIDPSELTGTILFARAGGSYGDETLFLANADGSGDERIGGFLADQTTCCMRWSPDGLRISIAALAPDGHFATGIIDRDGTDFEILKYLEGTVNYGCSNAWSRATDRMACEAGGAPGDEGVYTVRASDGGDLQRLTDVHGIPMDFSPDGSQVVFIGEAVGGPTGVDPGAPVGSLFVVNVDGTGLHQITPDGVYATSTARWSPDGSWILFGGLARTGDPIWVVRPDGSDFHELYKASDGRGAGCPTWSPDGAFVLFCLNPPGTVATLSQAPWNGLYVIRADGSGLLPVIETRDWKRDPDWTAE